MKMIPIEQTLDAMARRPRRNPCSRQQPPWHRGTPRQAGDVRPHGRQHLEDLEEGLLDFGDRGTTAAKIILVLSCDTALSGRGNGHDMYENNHCFPFNDIQRNVSKKHSYTMFHFFF